MLENNKVNEFKILTEWYSNRLLLLKNRIEDPILLLPLLKSLLIFQEDINANYSFANKTFYIFMNDILSYIDQIVKPKDVE